jgi:xylulokinase
MPIIVPSSDTATTLGAAILAGVGVGIYENFEEAVRLTVIEKRYHQPDLENERVYAKNYQTYLELYQNLKDLMTKVSADN